MRTIMALSLLLVGSWLSAEVPEKRTGKLVVKINLNSEVMNALLNTADCAKRLRQERNLPPMYTDAIETFKQYRSHPAVQELCSDAGHGWNSSGFNYFAEYPLYFAELPEGKRIAEYGEELLERLVVSGVAANDREGKIRYLDAYWEKVRDFYKTSDFPAFIKKNKDLYRSYVEDVHASLSEHDLVRMLEDYHGRRDVDVFSLVPSPLQLPNGGNFGFSIKDTARKSIIFCLLGISRNEKTRGYDYKGDHVELVLHEFGHSFSNPVNEKHLAEIGKYKFLMPGIAEKMRRWGYSERDWNTAVGELLANSIVARLILKVKGEKAAQEFLDREEGRGFVFISDFYDLLDVYEKNRDKYKTLYDFYPRLVGAFSGWGVYFFEERLPLQLSWYKKTPDGVLITGIDAGGAGYRSGVRRGDSIIEINGKKIESEEIYLNWCKAFESLGPGGSLNFLVARKGRRMNIQVKSFSSKAARAVKLGKEFKNINLRRHLDLGLWDAVETENMDGILIYSADPDKAGYLAGIREDDVVKAINGVPMTRLDDYLKFCEDWKTLPDGANATFTIVRNGAELDIRVENKDWEEVVETVRISGN